MFKIKVGEWGVTYKTHSQEPATPHLLLRTCYSHAVQQPRHPGGLLFPLFPPNLFTFFHQVDVIYVFQQVEGLA